jgi:hypothetical protein
MPTLTGQQIQTLMEYSSEDFITPCFYKACKMKNIDSTDNPDFVTNYVMYAYAAIMNLVSIGIINDVDLHRTLIKDTIMHVFEVEVSLDDIELFIQIAYLKYSIEQDEAML